MKRILLGVGISVGILGAVAYFVYMEASSEPVREEPIMTVENEEDPFKDPFFHLEPLEKASPGDSFVTYVESEGIGNIAVQISLPEQPRYESGAPVIIPIATFFTEPRGFDQEFLAMTYEGFIHVGYLWPGKSMPEGYASEGEFDYGGEDSIAALRDVIAFASGSQPNADGYMLQDLVDVTVDYENTGLYAFSHTGIAMTNVMALYGEELPNVSYLIGRENPTDDVFSSVELGYWEDGIRYINPMYDYSKYSSEDISIDYQSARYDHDLDRAYFDLNNSGHIDAPDHVLGSRIPSMFGKRYYSIEMTRALANTDLVLDWPDDLATVEEVEAIWPFRTSVGNYELLSDRDDLHVMLVFSSTQHVQAAYDAPSVHQAYDGFSDAGLWVRFNPDASYIEHTAPTGFAPTDYLERDAETEPEDWSNAGEEWGYAPFKGAAEVVGIASILEMADRTWAGDWSADLDGVIQ